MGRSAQLHPGGLERCISYKASPVLIEQDHQSNKSIALCLISSYLFYLLMFAPPLGDNSHSTEQPHYGCMVPAMESSQTIYD
jgi:hypothetical protein